MSIDNTIENISLLFLKLYYTDISFSLGLDINYDNIFSDPQFRGYKIEELLHNTLNTVDTEDKKKKDVAEHKGAILIKILNRIEEITDIDDDILGIFFYLIERMFKRILKTFRISPRSFLSNSIIVKDIKTYEIKLFIELLINVIPERSSISNLSIILLRNGGIAGQFINYTQNNLIQSLLKS
ncbi:MAG: hypothetical protein GF364_00230, partial [Candidatus Lokiarchaeota archaeon]|nr:hypothetical protein [Candidatus Lokiarchaeota archaeon]